MSRRLYKKRKFRFKFQGLKMDIVLSVTHIEQINRQEAKDNTFRIKVWDSFLSIISSILSISRTIFT